MRIVFSTILLFLFAYSFTYAQEPSNRIIGKWMSVQDNLIVEVYKDINIYKGKVVWFKDSDDTSRPMNTRTDIHNPDVNLQKRKVLGLEVIGGLTYNAKNNHWENGKLYDVKTGKLWNSNVWIEKENFLKVRGFWHYEFMGRTMSFRRL
jgi:uncharacterized protein (DUF2147 family)